MSISSTKQPLTTGEYARFLRRYLRSRMHLVAVLGVILLASISLQILNPQIMRNFIDTARAGGDLVLLRNLALLFIGIAIFQQLIGVLAVYITENLGWATTNDLRLDLARYCLGLDMSFHTAHTPGEMIERIDGDVMALSNFFSQFILQVFGNGLLVFGVLLVLAIENWQVGLTLGIFVLITVIILIRMANFAVPSWEKERQASAELYGFLEERLSGTEDIRSNNAMNYVLDRFYRLTRELMQKTLRAGMRWAVLMNTTWVLFAVGNSLALIVSAYLFKTNTITLGTVFMIVYYNNMINWPLERITQQFQDLQRAGASLVRIMGIQGIQGKIAGEEIFNLPDRLILPQGPLAVEFGHVTFGYSDSTSSAPHDAGLQKAENPSDGDPAEKEMVLRDISFRLEPGKVVGLLGRTGSGKTTLTRLIFRLYDPDRGSICLGSSENLRDISQVPPQELRRRVG
ncbi:MAG: ABC transporter ATP-binding protein, partial [Omnitrophica WOR_2 bacterium]